MTAESHYDVIRVKPEINLKPLTGIRFFAAAMIVEGHSWQIFEQTPIINTLMLNHGVSIFFVLSGFILACAYPALDDVKSKRFFIGRFARIWPAHILSTALLFVLVPKVMEQFYAPGGLITAIHYLTLTHTWYPTWQNVMAYNGVSWSIATEAFFYATFPLWIMDWGRLNPLKLPLAFLPLLFLIQLANQFNLPLDPSQPGFTAKGLLYFFPVARLPEFVMGVVVGQFWNRHRFVWSHMVSICATVAALLLTGLALYLTWPMAHDPLTASLLGPVGYTWFLETGFTPVYALLIFVLASSTGPISDFLGSRPLLLLGEISFGMYLFHTVIIRYYQTFPGLIDPSSISWRVLYWASVLSIAYLAFELVEKPARQAITRRASKNESANPKVRIALLFVAALIAAAAILRPLA